MNSEFDLYDLADGTPWEANEFGLWCPNCGDIIQASFHIDELYQPPETCSACGYPEFME